MLPEVTRSINQGAATAAPMVHHMNSFDSHNSTSSYLNHQRLLFKPLLNSGHSGVLEPQDHKFRYN